MAEVDAARELPAEVRAGAATGAQRASATELDDFYAQARELGYQTPDGAPDRQRIREVLKTNGYQSFNPAEAPRLLSVLRQARADTQA